MKFRNLYVFILIAVGLAGASRFVRAFSVGDTLSISSAEKKWGSSPFIAEKFKTGTPGDRASMAVDVIRQKSFLRKPVSEVFSTLGRSDGHFFSDLIPAYLLNEGWKDGNDTWQLVFLIDGEKVSDVVIQKNCCATK